jgi:hypothetical protein
MAEDYTGTEEKLETRDRRSPLYNIPQSVLTGMMQTK